MEIQTSQDQIEMWKSCISLYIIFTLIALSDTGHEISNFYQYPEWILNSVGTRNSPTQGITSLTGGLSQRGLNNTPFIIFFI